MKSTDNNTNSQNNKFLITLNDLIDDMEYENNINSDLYQEKGEIYDKEKMAWDLKGNSIGRYTSKYIHSIMQNEDLEKFLPNYVNNKTTKSYKNGK